MFTLHLIKRLNHDSIMILVSFFLMINISVLKNQDVMVLSTINKLQNISKIFSYIHEENLHERL